MSVPEIFFQSALINSILFLWLASAVSTSRILIQCDKKATEALLYGIFFGPVGFFGSFIYQALYKPHKSIQEVRPDISRSRTLVAIFLVSVFLLVSLYWVFVRDGAYLAASGELLTNRIALGMICFGFLGGLLLAYTTRRVAFFESVWCTCIFALGLLLLKRWADQVFAYGTSAVYFSTLIISASVLLLVFMVLGGSLGYLLCGEGRINLSFTYERFIGFRFLMTKGSSQVVSLITVISVIAVMIACGGMIVVMSVMNGFSSDLRSKILGANAHLMVLKYGKDFGEYPDIIKKTENISGVTGVSSFVLKEGMVSSDKNLSGALITGIDIERAQRSGELSKYVNQKSVDYLNNPKSIPVIDKVIPSDNFNISNNINTQQNQLPGVILGKEMAADLQVFVGEQVNLISPVGEMGPTGPIPKAKPFRVAGFFYSGMYEYDAKFAYIKLEHAQEFFNLSGSVSGVQYRVENIDNTRKIAQEIEQAIGGYPFYIRDWMQMNRPMFSALQLEKIAMLIILGTLIFMASLLILVTLIMVVIEKGKEIAILKSMGATDASVMKIFVTYGLCVGGAGALLGGGLGVLLCLLVEKVGIRLDPDVYYFSNLPVRVDFLEVSLVVIAAVIISFLATIPPSLFAARLKPVEGLRYE